MAGSSEALAVAREYGLINAFLSDIKIFIKVFNFNFLLFVIPVSRYGKIFTNAQEE
ncbi:MAG: hypothetical protein JWQ79_951 [Mucilaginibacter sp.]|nr:hypothetical protein [Mucilaginibacter sp.]